MKTTKHSTQRKLLTVQMQKWNVQLDWWIGDHWPVKLVFLIPDLNVTIKKIETHSVRKKLQQLYIAKSGQKGKLICQEKVYEQTGLWCRKTHLLCKQQVTALLTTMALGCHGLLQTKSLPAFSASYIISWHSC